MDPSGHLHADYFGVRHLQACHDNPYVVKIPISSTSAVWESICTAGLMAVHSGSCSKCQHPRG
jgi:hypothetical protein